MFKWLTKKKQPPPQPKAEAPPSEQNIRSWLIQSNDGAPLEGPFSPIHKQADPPTQPN